MRVRRIIWKTTLNEIVHPLRRASMDETMACVNWLHARGALISGSYYVFNVRWP